MSRIGSLSANTSLIQQFLRTQDRVFDLQVQATTKKVSQDYAGLSTNSQRLLDLENTKDQLEQFISNNSQSEIRLDIMTTAVEGIRAATREFQTQLSTYEQGAHKDKTKVDAVQDAAFRALRDIEDLLNIDIDGRFLFAGGRINTEPVDFQAPSVATFQAKFNGSTTTVPTTRDANLENFSFSQDENNKNKLFIDPSKFLQFRQDGDGVVTTGGNSSITATSALFTNAQVGSTITVTNTASNNGTYTIESIANGGRTINIKTEMLTTEAAQPGTITYRDPADVNKTITIPTTSLGSLGFNRGTNTITAATANSLAGIPAGVQITVAGTATNNGNFTVDTNDGTNIVIKSTKLTDEGLTTGNSFFSYTSGTQLDFNDANGDGTNTISVKDAGDTAFIERIFNGLAPGDQIALTNTVSNNATFTIQSIGTNGRSITATSTVTVSADDADGANIAGVANTGSNGFSYEAGTIMAANTAANTITIRNAGDTANVTGVFSNLVVGQSITVSNHVGLAPSPQTATITAISADGSQVTVDALTGAGGNDTNGATVDLFAAAGTVTAASFYKGDQLSLTHRVSDRREFEYNVTGADPGFEKVIRGMMLILQGTYGTEGGLDNNPDRIATAQFLVESGLERTVTTNTQFATEQSGSIEEIQQTIGFNQVLLDRTDSLHKDFIGFLDNSIGKIENVDDLDVITRLLDDTRTLEASFQAFARVRQLSLTNFI